MAATIVEFIMSLHLARYFFRNSPYFQYSQVFNWLPSITGIKYIVGIDGLSLMLVLLSTFFSMFAMITTYTSVQSKTKGFLILFLILESTLIGVFSSLDVVLFYFFWEASLIPIYFMIGIWGGKDRVKATLKFFIYGVVGSVFMLVSLIYLYIAHFNLTGIYSSNLLDLYTVAIHLPFYTQTMLFLAVTLAFAIKVPVFPFYSWLPDTYEQSPAIYTIMSGVMLKLATYGLIRFSICLFPVAAEFYGKRIAILSVIGIIYGALIAWQQTNIRRIMAFSSLSHLGFIVLGIFSFNLLALQGALYQMINHAITAGALFILFNVLYERKGSFDINDFGGLAKILPWFSFFFIIACMGSVALPSTGSFIGEWLILIGAFQVYPIVATIASIGVVLGAVYILWIAHKVLFGPLRNGRISGLKPQETFQMIVLSLSIFILGFASSPILEHARPTLLLIEKTVQDHVAYQSQLMIKGDNSQLIPLTTNTHFGQGR